MPPSVVNLNAKLALFSAHWSPKIVAQMNDYHFKVVKVQGDFTWHRHTDTDEVFILLAGELRIDFRDGLALLRKGDLLVAPRGIEHKPYAENECHPLVVEPAGTVNTGDAGGEWTAREEWI